MRSIALFTLMIISLPAQAQFVESARDLDEDRKELPAGTKLILQKDLIIAADMKGVSLNGKISTDAFKNEQDFSSCLLLLSEKMVSRSDRILKAGSSLQISERKRCDRISAIKQTSGPSQSKGKMVSMVEVGEACLASDDSEQVAIRCFNVKFKDEKLDEQKENSSENQSSSDDESDDMPIKHVKALDFKALLEMNHIKVELPNPSNFQKSWWQKLPSSSSLFESAGKMLPQKKPKHEPMK